MAYGFVQIYSAANSASGGKVSVPGVVVSAGNRFLVEITYGSATTLTETIADGTNTYSSSLTHQNIGGDTQTYALYECLAPAAGTYQVDFTPGSNVPFRGVSAYVYSGLDNTTPAQAVSNAQFNPGTGTDAVTTTNITPASQPGALIAASTDDLGTASAVNAGTGYTGRGTITNWDSTLGVVSRLEDIRLTSTSAKAGTFTCVTSGGGELVSFGVFIPEASGGGGGGTTTVRKSLLGVGI